MTAGTPAPQDAETVDEVALILGQHRYREVLGDYEIKPFYRHFGCSCGWEQDIAGMSGYWSWREAHEAHVADMIREALASVRAREVEAARREAWDEGYQAGMATEYAYREAPFGRDVTEPENPYRDLAATHAETEEG